ncbi:MAG: DUF2163 domain-containing protein [Pseudomonadota bacterium]
MRTLDPAFEAHLTSGATTLCRCWRITRRDGVVLGFTDHDAALSFDGATFQPETGADGAALAESADFAVDNAEIEGALSADALSAQDLAAGRYDGARVDIWRVNWAAPDQRLLLKSGVVGDVSRRGSAFTAELRGPAHALDQRTGRVYQRLCDAVLGDERCGVDLDDAAFVGAGVVIDVIDATRFLASGLEAFDANWFAHGALSWVSGDNAGARGHIASHGDGPTGAALALWTPPGVAIAVGDAFAVTAGCDKRHQTCTDKFANLVNFRGFHLMPGNDFAVSYPLRGEDNDGGRR